MMFLFGGEVMKWVEILIFWMKREVLMSRKLKVKVVRLSGFLSF